MLLFVHAAPPRRARPDTALKPPQPGINPLDWVNEIAVEDHILVLGGHGADLMCALLRAGARNVMHLRSHERPEADSADLVIVAEVPSLDWLATALPSIRRALTGNARVIVRAGQKFKYLIDVRRMLTLHGFTAIRVVATGEGQAVGATIRKPSIQRRA